MIVTLELGDQTAEVSPLGGVLRSYRVRGAEVIAGVENPELYAFRGALLAPWPNRVTAGRWMWEGVPLQLPVNDPGADAALHGLVHDQLFDVEAQTATTVTLTHELRPSAGYPFSLLVRVTYALTSEGLVCSLSAVNRGTAAAPVGLGVHAYVAAAELVDDLRLTLPARTLLRTDEAWNELSREPVSSAGVDFRAARRIGGLHLDAAFTDLDADDDGRVEVVYGLPDGTDVVMWSGATCTWLVVYTGDTLPPADRRRSMAVEPMTCGPNALVTGEATRVEPDCSLQLDWGFTVRPPAAAGPGNGDGNVLPR